MEELTVNRWIFQTLSNDEAIRAVVGERVFDTIAPNNAEYPIIVFSSSSPRDVRGVRVRAMSTFSYTVKVIDKAKTYSGIEALAEAIDKALELKSGPAAGGVILSCHRETPFSYIESVDGLEFRHLGGLYFIAAKND